MQRTHYLRWCGTRPRTRPALGFWPRGVNERGVPVCIHIHTHPIHAPIINTSTPIDTHTYSCTWKITRTTRSNGCLDSQPLTLPSNIHHAQGIVPNTPNRSQHNRKEGNKQRRSSQQHSAAAHTVFARRGLRLRCGCGLDPGLSQAAPKRSLPAPRTRTGRDYSPH